jgi:hypothetical protein
MQYWDSGFTRLRVPRSCAFFRVLQTLQKNAGMKKPTAWVGLVNANRLFLEVASMCERMPKFQARHSSPEKPKYTGISSEHTPLSQIFAPLAQFVGTHTTTFPQR